MPNPVTSGLVSEVHHTSLSAGAVATWADESGNGNNWVQATGTKQPTKDSTGVLFDGTADSLQCNALSSVFAGADTAHTVFVVAAPATVAAGVRVMIGAGSSSDANPIVAYRLDGPLMETSRRGDAGEEIPTMEGDIAETQDESRIFTYRQKFQQVGMWSNGTRRFDELRMECGTLTVNRVSVGSLIRTTEALYWSGYIQAVLVYNRGLTPAEMNSVHDYLAGLYGQTVTEIEGDAGHVPDLVSSWWALPRAVTVGTKTYVGGVSAGGRVVLGELGGAGERISLDTYSADDHNTPAILHVSGKVPVIFSTDHAGNLKRMRWFKGSTVDSFSAFGARKSTVENLLEINYSQAYSDPANTDHCVVMARVGGSGWSLWESTDYFDSVGSEVPLFSFSDRGYVATVQLANGDIRCALYHLISGTDHKIYYCLIEIDTGDIKNLAGSVLGNFKTGTNLPLAVSGLDVVYTPTDGVVTRLHDISDATDIEVAFSDWTNDEVDSVYKYAKWNGTSWDVNAVAATGARFGYEDETAYFGGICFPRSSPGGVVYLSRENSGTWTIEKQVTADSGSNWTATVLATAPSGHKYVRPYALAAGDPYEVVYVDLTHYGTSSTGYTDYAGSLRGLVETPPAEGRALTPFRFVFRRRSGRRLVTI